VDDKLLTQIIKEVFKNPAWAILALVFFGYADLRKVPESLDFIQIQGVGSIKEIKNELVELRKDVTSLELTIIDESNQIKKEQDLQHEKSERIMAYVDEIQKKVGIKTESQRKN